MIFSDIKISIMSEDTCVHGNIQPDTCVTSTILLLKNVEIK